jgi:hypothetical protein
LLIGRSSCKGIADFTGDIDDHVKARRLFCSWLEIEKDIVAVDGNRAIGIPRRFLVLVILNLVVRFSIVSSTVRDLWSYR